MKKPVVRFITSLHEARSDRGALFLASPPALQPESGSSGGTGLRVTPSACGPSVISESV